MAGNERFDDAISSWLQESAPTRLPERALAATFDRTRRTRQDRDWRGVLGSLQVPRSIPALGGAAVVVVAAALLAITFGLVGGTSAPPTSSPPATMLPSAPARPPAFLPTMRPGEAPTDWIAYRSGPDYRAVDANNPDHTVVIGRNDFGADPIAWAPDGTRLLLGSHLDAVPVWMDGGWGIPQPGHGLFVLSADGSRSVIGRSKAGERCSGGGTWGTFSPDGTEIAYATCGGAPGPYVVQVDGKEPRSLLGEPCIGPGCGEPIDEWAAWSPVSSHIAWLDFWEDHPGFGHHARALSFVDADGKGLREAVLQLPEEAGGLTWSPDGLRLAFWAIGPGENGEEQALAQVYVVNADGSGLHPITHEGDNRWPSWSPDGTRIAVARGELRSLAGSDGSHIEYVEPGSRWLVTVALDGTDLMSFEAVHPEGPIAWAPISN